MYNRRKKFYKSKNSRKRRCLKGGDTVTEESKEARRAYKREWARKNPEKVRAAQDRYWARRAAEQAAKEKNGESLLDQGDPQNGESDFKGV